jgi:uncharacterized RDD family membrane protein YckC
MSAAISCQNCGAAHESRSNFCGRCGSRMASLPATMPSPPMAPVVQPAAPQFAVAKPIEAQITADRVCYSCGRSWGLGRCCQFCRQVAGAPSGVFLSSPIKRLGANLVEGLIVIFTLGIGWLIWELIVFKDGQTPGKQLLGMRVVHLQSGRHAGWGRMFLREYVAKSVVAIFVAITFGVGGIVYFWLLWDKDNQELWDKVVETIVVDDPMKQLAA